MTNKKSTKKALLMSCLSLLLCMSMLVGTTFAWFTDSVSSAKNQIVAGNLDVELEYAKVVNGQLTGWATVAGAEDLFNPEALWEPGRVEVVYLKVSNLGTLALKYQLGVNVYGETAGTNVAGESFKLSDYLVFKTVEMPDALTTYTDREAAQLASGGAMGLTDYNGTTTSLEVDGVDYVALIVYMPESVGNEANYRGDAVPTIEMGVNLYATQYTYEADSYGPDYDENAKLPIGNAEDLAAAMTEGGIYVLAADITVDANAPMTVPTGVEVILDMNGHEINASANTNNANKNVFIVKGDVTIFGNGTLSTVFTGENMGWSRSSSIFSVEAGTLTLGEGVSVINYGGTNMAYGVDVNTTVGESVLNVNGATILSTYTAVREFNNSTTANAIVNFNSGLIAGDSRDIWVHNPSANAVDANGIVNIAAGYDYDLTVQTTSYNGRIYNFDYGYVLVNSATALQTALNNAVDGDVIVLACNITGNVTATQKENVDVVIDGIGNKFTGTIYIHGQARANGAETLTIKNVNFVANETMDFISSNSTASTERYAHNVTIQNCSFTGNGAEVMGARFRQAYNITMKDCVADGMYGILWATGCNKITVDNVDASNGRNGISVGTSNATITNCDISAAAYGVRADGGAYTLTLENNNISAPQPVVVRKLTAAGYTLNLSGNTFTATGADAYQVILTTGSDDAAYVAPAAANYTINGQSDLAFFK